MLKYLEITIFGQVQGVFFRSSAEKKAKELDITGFAKNMPDGSVYIEAEGEEEKLKEFLAWCEIGPRNAKVEKIESKYSSDLKSFVDFQIG